MSSGVAGVDCGEGGAPTPARSIDPRTLATRIVRLALVLVLSLGCGCGTVITNTTMFSDTSHLGTPYSGSRQDLHGLVCYGRDIRNDTSALFYLPVAVLILADLPVSFVFDTLLLPIDIPKDAARPPLEIGGGGCSFFGM